MRSSSGHRPARAQLTRLRLCLIVCGRSQYALMIPDDYGLIAVVWSLVWSEPRPFETMRFETVVYKLEGPALLGRCSKEEK